MLPYKRGNHNSMPVYEYKCKKCNTVFDRLIAINDDHIIRCPECDGETKKLISSAGIIFKGSGFYINDYSKKTDKDKKESKSTVKTENGKTESLKTAQKGKVSEKSNTTSKLPVPKTKTA